MASVLDKMSQHVAEFIDSVHQRFLSSLESDDAQHLEQLTVSSLNELTMQFGTADYGFNLAIEHYVEHFCELIHDVLPGILASHLPRQTALARASESTDIAFAAYYALSLIYKKENREEALRSLAGAKYTFFTRLYPLAFEVRSRYHKRVHEYEEALEYDEQAIDFLDAQGIHNHALCISYASTVCRMYDQGYPVEALQRSYAAQYIRDAISFNPEYPKYHFLRAKLLFHSARSLTDYVKMQEICQEALSSIKRAKQLQMGQPGAHFEKALREYNDLRNLILQEQNRRLDQSLPFRHISQRELRDQLQHILNSADAKECLPPNPNLMPGQKFIFISYSHCDYKSVYCDLLQLYARKIPFQYDGTLPKGTRWDSEVHDYINHEDCVGVLFFVSKNTLLSEAVEQECRLVREVLKERKPYFSVNLEGSTPPSQILMRSILQNGVDACLMKGVDNNRMVRFLTTFHDDITFVPKDPNDSDDGTDHLSELISAIMQVFPQLQTDEPQPIPVGI